MKNVKIKSIFNFRVFLIPGLIVFFLIVALVGSFFELIKLNAGETDLKEIWLPIIASILLILIFLHEFKNKIINVKIENDTIEKRTFLGYKKTFNFKDFDGFELRIEKGKVGSYEYLYLMKNNKPIITIAQTYLENYHELKNMVSKKSKDLGYGRYGLLSEIKDLLTLN
ncbi:hypothetical protein [Flavobacterium sp. KBS0721]|uniref:hypothetical protein n=1 Tax=Flavobacterium sp. KBS0721 TaxID=1179672 RepID=UPI00098E951F|nr:hypothetical protein [Flavobacterium sp. KBS0721]QDW19997.1 hypothetical protein B0M43_0007685 [Flavobacterium sp. KBS0721]